jgi:hypothetical protein
MRARLRSPSKPVSGATRKGSKNIFERKAQSPTVHASKFHLALQENKRFR